ncbi:MAG: HAD family hydrolase [Alphaproteobacteria bacterium]
MTIQAVVFDAYGTLVHIPRESKVHRTLFGRIKTLSATGLKGFDPHQSMREPMTLRDIAVRCGVVMDEHEMQVLEENLKRDQQGVEVFPDAVYALKSLRHRGLKVAVCSNLGVGFAEPVLRHMPFALDAYAWSYEIGAVKDEPAIYQWVCQKLELKPEQILFTGDTYKADVLGPRVAGMRAVHLQRDRTKAYAEAGISDLMGILGYVQGKGL